ncbi:MAG: hypothetical protein A2W93_06935 [Bacteroidetes bacterium GWF2_43_63]|nr:MAG: hypothetical protein A2W94_09945 [Bacteroidetes bacterium GWE2_42_42]OFY53749.1 MAG: hypothetical protein A2W93_06935 [Bacteroidetes bacterium GWF2_43_63]HCB61030.1 hypothetical protein [Bacteroidales bacterium]HCY24152.1 hypothetical protein [Bacteroidales bacterium]
MNAQTVVFSDDFNSVTSDTYTTSGAIGTSAWSVIRGGGDFGARRRATAPNCIELSNDVSGTANAANWVFAYTSTASYGSPYNTVLSSNPGIVTWTFNMKSNRTTALANPIGDLTKYSCAYVLGS